MAAFLQWTLPMPVVAAPGGTQALPTMLTNDFGSSPNGWNDFWVTYYPSSQLSAWDFSYWNLSSPSVATWYVGGGDIGGGFGNQRYVPAASIGTALLHVGNDIGPLAYVTVPSSVVAGTEYIQYSIMTIDPHVLSPVAGLGEPTPQDVVDSAYRFANYYGLVPNDNDCHFISAAVAAATGATFTDLTGSLDPTQNQEGGFWRIAYRGSDPNPVSNWQTLVHPGDIVRMGWIGGGQHTTTVLSVNPDHSMAVYDNSDFVGGTEVIGVHTVNYDQQTIPTTITIYRLAADGLYLENGSSLDEILPGTIFNDHVLGLGGNDQLWSSAGADVLDGGAGFDTVSYASAGAGVTANLDLGIGAGGDAQGDSYTSIEAVTGSAFNDVLIGKAGVANVLRGGAGDDIIAGEGIDSVDGGPGNDVFFGGQGSALNINLATSSIETVWGSIVSDVMDGSTSTANLTLVGQGFYVGIPGGPDDPDTMLGGSGNDFVYYRAGDIIDGGASNDWAVASLSVFGVNLDMTATHFENAWGSTSADTITAAGSATTAVIVGDAGNDALTGGNAGDFLYGFSGNDTLNGGAGNDNLIGGAGTDTFAFSAGWGTDIVWDWVDGSEHFNLQGSGATSFGDLTVDQNYFGSGNAYITFGTNHILVVGGANQISAGDFLF